MKILYIAPLPPPICGHSLMSKAFFDELDPSHTVSAVNLSKNSFAEGLDSFQRVLEVLNILKQVWLKKKNADAIYLTISESFAGNLKDLFIYLICFSLLPKMYIHLHGGSIKRQLWDFYPILHKLNKFFIRRMAGVILSGPSHLTIFEEFVDKRHIHFVPNFAPDHLFLPESEIRAKFSVCPPLRILYISHFIPKKGYSELLDAYLELAESTRRLVRIDFAGKFDSEELKRVFLKKIEPHAGLCYHGIVEDAQKRKLFSQAHVFCLPTSFFEGQPVSILEAYASGCVVLTTGQSGILDIFADGINGHQIQEKSPESIRMTLERIVTDPAKLLEVALYNSRIAGQKYRMTTYNSALSRIVESSVH